MLVSGVQQSDFFICICIFIFYVYVCVCVCVYGFPCGSAGKESACNAGDLGLIPGLGEGKGYPLQYSGLENSMHFIVHGVAKSRTRLSNFNFHIYFRLFYLVITKYCSSLCYTVNVCYSFIFYIVVC